jgi:hypothetical protein
VGRESVTEISRKSSALWCFESKVFNVIARAIVVLCASNAFEGFSRSSVIRQRESDVYGEIMGQDIKSRKLFPFRTTKKKQ